MLLTIGVYNSRARTITREYALCYPSRRYHDSNLLRRLVQCLRDTGNITSATPVNAGCPRVLRTTANESAIIVAVERKPWKISDDIT